jgi:hypothetical protein
MHYIIRVEKGERNMEHYTKRIFDRIDLQHIRNYLITGGDFVDPYEPGKYGERLGLASDNILTRLKQAYKDDKNELDEALNDLDAATAAYQNVFLEIGMKMGARMFFQLLC